MSAQPKVSVCIPVYNPGPFLVDAIGSVLAQSFEEFELWVVDDGSTQPVEPLIAGFTDSRLRFKKNRRNLGLVGNWNCCVQLAQGRYIAIFHQDDIMHPDNLRTKVEALDANPGAGFVYSDIWRIDDTGKIIGGHWITQPNTDSVFSGKQMYGMIAASGNPISCPSVVVRQECYQHLGLFDARLPFTADLEMWMRIAAHYDVLYLAKPLIYQRVHSAQATARFQGTGRDYSDVLRALDIVRSRALPLEVLPAVTSAYKTLSSHAVQMARWKMRQGQIASGTRYAVVATAAWLRFATAIFAQR